MLNEIHEINSRLKTVRIAFAATIFYSSQEAANLRERSALLDFVENFIHLFGDDFQSFYIDQTKHDTWTGKKKSQQLSTLRRKLQKTGTARDFTFFLGKGDGAIHAEPPQPTEFGLFANPHYARAICGFFLPVEILQSQSKDIEECFVSACESLKAEQGYGGLSVVDRAGYYFDGSVQLDELRTQEIRELLLKFPGLDYHFTNMNELPWLSSTTEFRKDSATRQQVLGKVKPVEEVWGLRWPAWLNYIDGTWMQKTFVRTTELPSLQISKELEAFGKATQKWRIKPDLNHPDDLVMLTDIFGPEEMIAWIQRFDGQP